MLYLIKKNGKYTLPYYIWKMVKQYAGIYNLTTDYTAVSNVRTGILYGLHRRWFGRFIIPDNYDFLHVYAKRRWLLKNLVKKNNYKMTEERYNRLIFVSNSPIDLLDIATIAG